MELLEKITLYDLLGYALPGSIVLYKVMDYDGTTEVSTFGIVCFCVLAYVFGITISEISAFITKGVEGICFKRSKLCTKTGVSKKRVEKALQKANVITDRENLAQDKDVWNYYGNMYSDLQIDKDCGRLHNYAAGVLLYKNVALSAIICGILELTESGIGVNSIVCCIIAFCCAHRWYRVKGKLITYVFNWYVIKYKA